MIQKRLQKTIGPDSRQMVFTCVRPGLTETRCYRGAPFFVTFLRGLTTYKENQSLWRYHEKAHHDRKRVVMGRSRDSRLRGSPGPRPSRSPGRSERPWS